MSKDSFYTKLKKPFDHTWKGLIFGTVCISLCISISVVTPLAVFCIIFIPDMSANAISVFAGGLTGGLVVLSIRVLKSYWDWADRVMARLFGGRNEPQVFFSNTLHGALFGWVLLVLCGAIFIAFPLVLVLEYAFPDLNVGIICGICGGLMGGLIASSRRTLTPYWDWADRVMARLFGGSEGSGDKA